MFKKIESYCLAKYIPNKKEEAEFLKEASFFINSKNTLNSGKLAEWYISEMLENSKVNFQVQPKIEYKIENTLKFIKPDFYIPDKNLFIEVKSKTFNCSGTASEKIDHIPRKYSKLEFSQDIYSSSKVLVIFCGGELSTPSTKELICKDLSKKSEYTIEFIKLARKHKIVDWGNSELIKYYI